MLYFRQQVLSTFGGNKLVADTTGSWDRDVVQAFPREGRRETTHSQALASHVKVPTSVFLLVDHPQPVTLGHTIAVSSVPNPSPRRFVTAYKAESYLLNLPFQRLVGRSAGDASWTDTARAHYLEVPDDPRYQALSDIIVRNAESRFMNDPIMKAFAIKRYLETKGFYTMSVTYGGGPDPTADFLFGSMRGYCVHFAHAAAYLYRTQGIPARVALGYAVQMKKRAGGSSLLIMSNEAHAWPEIYLDGVGWITFDIYPEASDEPPRPAVDRDLESLLGEVARDDKSGGMRDEPLGSPFEMPWLALGYALLALFGAGLVGAYGVKLHRRVLAVEPYRVNVDRLADLGITREFGETREAYSRRLHDRAPSFAALTDLHLRGVLGPRRDDARLAVLGRKVGQELRKSTPGFKRILGILNPIGWFYSR